MKGGGVIVSGGIFRNFAVWGGHSGLGGVIVCFFEGGGFSAGAKL